MKLPGLKPRVSGRAGSLRGNLSRLSIPGEKMDMA